MDQTEYDETDLTRPRGNLTEHDRKLVFSPLQLVLTVGLAVFGIEASVMVLLDMLPDLGYLPKMHPVIEMLTDTTSLTLILSPILYMKVFRPLVHLIADYHAKEIELRDYQEELEDKVIERTSDLDEAIKLLEQEIEERRQIERALRDSEERIRQIMSQVEDAILLVDPVTLRIVDSNPIAERLFGQQRDELLGMLAGDLCGTDCSSSIMASLSYAKNPGDTCAIEQLAADVSDGERRIFSFRGKYIYLQGESLIYASFRDITRRVHLEREARETQRKLIHVNRMTSLGVLVSSVAHEINNPNHYILMNATLLQKSWRDILSVLRERYDREGEFHIGTTTFSNIEQFLPEAVDGICEGARQINGIVENLKNFIRDERSGVSEAANINAAVRLSVAILSHHISRCTTSFRLELDDGLPPVRGNSRKLEQVIINLIMNALQALPSPEKGVTVKSQAEGGWVVVTFSDEGCGIPPDTAAHMFDPFFTTRQEKGGTGLGLSISAEILREQGGCLDFTTVPGKGTVFTIRLQTAVTSSTA